MAVRSVPLLLLIVLVAATADAAVQVMEGSNPRKLTAVHAAAKADGDQAALSTDATGGTKG